MPEAKESGTVDPFADMPSGKTFIEEAREFALTLDPDIGPLFGRDVVRLLDALKAERDALRAAVRRAYLSENWPDCRRILKAVLERPE